MSFEDIPGVDFPVADFKSRCHCKSCLLSSSLFWLHPSSQAANMKTGSIPVCRSLPAVINTSMYILKQVFLETSVEGCTAVWTFCPFRFCCLAYTFLIITLPASSDVLWRSFFLWSWRMDLNFIEGLPELQDHCLWNSFASCTTFEACLEF